MPNRILKESICYSDDIDKLSPEEEIFFYRLIVNCDDYGRMDARLPILKAKLFPLKEHMKSDDINGYLMKLCDLNMIALYENNGVRYLQMVNWHKHQQIRAKRSKYPAPDDENSVMISNDIICNQLTAYVPENPIRIQSESESESNTNPNTLSMVVDFYQQNFTMITPHVREKMIDWLNDMESELIIKAMEIAVENNRRKWSYVEGILKRLFDNQVTTLKQYEALKLDEENKKQQQQPKQQYKSKLERDMDSLKRAYDKAIQDEKGGNEFDIF